MRRVASALGVAFMLTCVLAAQQANQQTPAGGAQAQGRGRGQTPDPRSAGGGRCDANPYNCIDTPNPLAPPNTVWLEELTWVDVRDAMKAGKTTIIIPTGGIEPNGPWLATQLRAQGQLRRDRSQAGECSVRADYSAGA